LSHPWIKSIIHGGGGGGDNEAYSTIGAWGRTVVKVVPGSNPGGVGRRDFFSWIPTEPCALGSTQPLKNEYQGFLWG